MGRAAGFVLSCHSGATFVPSLTTVMSVTDAHKLAPSIRILVFVLVFLEHATL